MQVRGKELVSLCPPEFTEKFQESCNEIMAGNPHDKFELAMYTEDKTDRVQLLINGRFGPVLHPHSIFFPPPARL